MYLFFQAPLVLGLLKNHGNINLNVRIIIPYYNWFEIFIFPLTKLLLKSHLIVTENIKKYKPIECCYKILL